MNSLINSLVLDEQLQRNVCAAASLAITTVVVGYITLGVLATFLWAWLAFILAACAAIACGKVAAGYARTTGYDAAVSVTAKVIGFFRK